MLRITLRVSDHESHSAIGLAILVVLFRNRGTINVDDLDAMRG